MSTNGSTTARTATATHTLLSTPATDHPEQLTLLATAEVPLQFRIDERTRRSGLAHVAALRAQVAAQASQRGRSTTRQRHTTRPASRQIAA